MSAPVGLEYKNAASPDAPAAPVGHEGVIEALVAVTGVRDDVGDIIVPGAFTKTLVARKPKVCLGHDWNRPIGKVLQVKELEPGHPDLPATTAEGKPWPKEAGAVWAQFQVNMDIDDGKNAFHSAKFYGPESTYSIGYKATEAKHKRGTRYIHELDLFEFGPVLHPANRLATLQSIKTGEPDGVENADLDAEEVKDFDPEELTLQDYLASLLGVEEKVIRYVSDSEYWGLPKGTPIRPGMKPKGRNATAPKDKAPTQGTTTKKPAAQRRAVAVGSYAVTRDGYAGEVIRIDGDTVTISKTGEALKTFPRADLSAGDAAPDNPIPVKTTEAQLDAASYALEDSEYSDEELGARIKNGTLEILDLGRAIDALDVQLEIMEDNPDRKKSSGPGTRSLRAKLVKMATFDDANEQGAPEPAKDDDKPAAQPEADKPATKPEKPSTAKTETEQDVRRVAEELDLEMRPNPAHPDYIIKPPPAVFNRSGERVMSFRADTGKAQANNGQVIPPGRVEEFLRTWQQEMDKSTTGYPPRADWVLDQMDKPAREAAAKAETDRKKREAVANATNEELAGQAEFEVDRLVRFEALQAEMRAEGRTIDEAAAERTRDRGRTGLELVNAELVKRGLPVYDLPGPKLSTKPTGGRPVREILDSIPDNREGGAARYNISNGADVIDEPNGSGVFAVGPIKGDEGRVQGTGEWAITLGNGLSIPASAMVRAQSNESAINVSTPKKVTAWLKAMGELRDADGNPPPYGTATGPELLAWRDADGRTLREALTDVVVPAYLKAIGKKGEVSDKSTPAKWKNAPLLAAQNLPAAMAAEFAGLGSNGKQAYILGRTEGDDHATALKRAKDMIANAQAAGSSRAPVSREDRVQAATQAAEAAYEAEQRREVITGDNQLQPTPEGEISTDRLLMLDRSTGPAAIAAMELPELERHDAELTRRAVALGKPGSVSPAHKAIKAAILRKNLAAQQDAADRARADASIPDVDPGIAEIRQRLAKQTDDPDEARRSGVPTRGLLAFTLAKDRLGTDVNALGYAVISRDGTPDQVRAKALDDARNRSMSGAGSSGFEWRVEQVERAVNEVESWNVDLGRDQSIIDNTKAWIEGSREGLADRVMPDALASVSMEDGRVLRPIEKRTGENQALGITSGDYTLRVYEEDSPNAPVMPWGYEIVNNATGGRVRSNATYRSPGSALVRAEGEFQAAERRDSAPEVIETSTVPAPQPQRTETIAPELLDEAAESEAATVGLTETPDGALEVEPEIAERQDRVEKLIKNADDGTLNLADQPTDELTSTRRDLVDELRLQTAIQRRAPRTPRPAADTPKVRPGLAGAAEDHAEALRSGDAAAIERTQARLRSSIRRSRVDSEIARSLADSITSPDDNDADQLSDLAKRLRAESRERRNATARKRRTAKRIERERLQSLLGAVDTELRGRGVELEQVSPELLAPDPEGDGRPKLTAKMRDVLLTARSDGSLDGHLNTIYGLMTHNLVQRAPGGARNFQLTPEGQAEVALLRDPKTDSTSGANVLLLNQDQAIENDIHRIYTELADGEGDWIRLARVQKKLQIPPADWERVLTAMGKTVFVHLAPESNTKVLTAEDRAAAVRLGSEDMHLITFEGDYTKPTGVAAPVEPDLTPDQKVENDIHQAYAELADGEEDWVRLSALAKRVNIPDTDWERVLTAMSKTGLVHLVPTSNTKVITDEDRAAAVRIGNEDKHMIAFDRDYTRPDGEAPPKA